MKAWVLFEEGKPVFIESASECTREEFESWYLRHINRGATVKLCELTDGGSLVENGKGE